VTTVRSLAVQLSKFVARHASAGSCEWAAGLTREIEFIEGDWRALVWALGSMRVLLERRSACADEGKWRWPTFISWGRWVLYGLVAFCFVNDAIDAKNWQVRLGSGIVALGWMYFGTRSIVRWWRDGDEPSDPEARMAHGRALLMEKLARARSMWRCISPVATMIMYCGLVTAHDIWSRRQLINAMFLTIWVILAQLAETPEKIVAQLVRVDALHAQFEAWKLRDVSVRVTHAEVPASPTFSRLFQRRRRSRRRALR
jgi:hypothetical protein